MILPEILDLSLIKVFDRGVANKECIAISVNEDTLLAQYGIMVGLYQSGGIATPYLDHMFWFGDGWVKKGDWLFIYTGPGKPSVTTNADGTGNIFTVHWGKAKTVFANSSIVPILFRIDSVNVLEPPDDKLQLPGLQA